MMHLQLHSSHVIKKRSNFEWGDDDYIDLQHKKALVRVARRLVHDTSHVTNLANILLEAQTNLSLISSRSGISFSLLYTSTVTDEIALLHFDNLATYFLFSQITDFEFIAQSTDFHFLNIYRFGVRRISFHFVSFRFISFLTFIAIVFLALDLAQWWEHSPIWPGFDSRSRRHMGVDFVFGSRPCSERFFSGYCGFPVSLKTNASKFQFDLDTVDEKTAMWMSTAKPDLYLSLFRGV